MSTPEDRYRDHRVLAGRAEDAAAKPAPPARPAEAELVRDPEPNTPPFPMTLAQPRTGSTHAWLAFPCAPKHVPDEAIGPDQARYLAWLRTFRAKLVGRGESPTQAISDMVTRLTQGRFKLWRDTSEWPD